MLSNSRVSVGFKMIEGQTLLARKEQKLAKFTLGIALARLGPILVFTEPVSDVNGICDLFFPGQR